MKSYKPSFARGRLMVLLFAIAGFAGTSAAALADEAQIASGHEVWSNAGCEACHGASGQGGVDPDQPIGPSLRSGALTPEEMTEVIRCGRPGTPMAAWEEGAYTEQACYGEPLGPVPSNILMIGAFSPEQITDLVAYIQETFVTKP